MSNILGRKHVSPWGMLTMDEITIVLRGRQENVVRIEEHNAYQLEPSF